MLTVFGMGVPTPIPTHPAMQVIKVKWRSLTMKIGYARVSTGDQNLDMQVDALNKIECDKIFTDKMSGARSDRPGLEEAMKFMREGDTLIVWRLDRLGRSLQHLIKVINDLNENGKFFMSLQENIDSKSTGGKLIFHIFAALAEFERDLIRERTKAGILAARARGRIGGRPRKMTAKKIEWAKKLMEDHSNSISEICKMLRISKSTLYRNLNGEADI